MLTKRQKRILSKTFRNQKVGRYGEYIHDWDDPLVINLSEDWRSRGDGEDVVYYTIFGYGVFDSDTDEQVDEFMDDRVRVTIDSPYTPTGRPFTTSLHWHRNPDGSISVVHRMALDI